MLFAAYTDVGGGICFLFFLALLVMCLLVWVVYWSRRGFRASAPRSRAGHITRWMIAALAIVVMVLFPPMRRSADWQDKATGKPTPALIALELDRYLFGYIPSYGWVGTRGGEQPYGCILTINGSGPHQCDSYRWVIAWLYLIVELLLLGTLLLPFLRPGSG